MTDGIIDLLDKIKQGDESSFAVLSERYSNLTESAVKKFAPSFGISDNESDGVIGTDDLKQSASMALYRAAVTYRPGVEGKKVSFGLYSKVCINNALISELRKYNSERRRQSKAKENLQRSEKNISDPISKLVSDENVAELLSRISESLSALEKEVFDYYVAGKSAREIAESLGKEEKSVSNALYRMKVKIKGLLKNQ